jgi:uncharacterized protein (TIGR02452 family)
MYKEDRIYVQEDTINIFKAGQYTLKDGTTVKLDKTKMEHSIKNTKKTTTRELSEKMKEFKNPNKKTQVLVVEADSFEAALVLSNKKHKVGVLNMASFKNPGGGYKNGAGAQEESLFRRTNLHECLLEKDYPIKFNELIFTPEVTVIKKSEFSKYNLLPKPEYLDIITCPAIKLYDYGQKFTFKEKQIVSTKIDMIFEAAIVNGDTSLVLGLFGAGAYKNDPNEVSALFKQALKKYDGYFDYIVFAIIDDKYTNNLMTCSKVLNIEALYFKDYVEMFE